MKPNNFVSLITASFVPANPKPCALKQVSVICRIKQAKEIE